MIKTLAMVVIFWVLVVLAIQAALKCSGKQMMSLLKTLVIWFSGAAITGAGLFLLVNIF